MASALDPEMDFPDLSSMLEQTLESEMYERDSSIDQPPYVDSSVEGSLCTKYLVAEQNAAASKEAVKSSEVAEENRFYENFIKENKRDRLSSLKCTVCKMKISRSNARTHPILDVLVCKPCRDVYDDGQFTQSDGTDDYCRWCAEGGVQVCCDSCSNVFCKECLKRNLGSKSAEEIEQSGHWNCLACNPRPIWNLRAECRWFMTASEESVDEESSSEVESQTSRKRTMDIVETAEEIGMKYLKNIQRIKRDLLSSSDTEVEDFCAAICRVLEKNEATMKQLRETLRGTRNIKTSTSSKETDSPVKDDSNSNEPRLILKVKNFREKSNEDGYYAEINNSPKPKTSSEKQNETPQRKSKAQNDEKESANSEDEKEVATAISDKTSATAEPVKETAEDSMDDFFDMAQAAMERSENSPQSPLLPEPENGDVSEQTTSTGTNLPEETNQKARQELLAISDSDSRPSLASSSPRIKKTRKRAEVTESLKLKSKSDGKKNESPKAGGSKEAKDKKDKDSDSDAAIEKRIKRLENLNLNKSKTSDGSSATSSTSKPKAKKEKQRRTAKLLLDDSDEESNPDKDGDIVTLDSNSVIEKLEADPKETAREELLAVSSGSSSDDERSGDELKKEKKKSNTAKKEKVKILDSDDYFETKDVKLDPEAAELLNLPIKDKYANEKEGKKDKKEKKKDGDEKKKRVKRRIKSDSEPEAISDSDFESDRDEKKESSGDSSDSNQPKQKRRRRIKAASSSGSGSDSDVQVLNDSQRSGGGKGRKNIKKIIKDKNLKDETKEAVREEQERIKRIAERQNFYNESFKDDYMTNARIEKLVLDFDTKTKKELVSVDKRLVEKLKPHQAKGIKFMWDACFESLERLKEHPGSGCILAHCMGLGKTLQVVTLAHTVLSNPDCKVKNVLVVCPLSTVLNWVNEFKTWLVDDMEQDVYELANVKQNDMRMYHVRMWSQNGGVLVMGYEMYRNITNEKNKRIKAKYREIFQKGLVDPGPDLVVCDEGHLLKNEASALSKAMNRIATRRRIVLTGTPLQNSLSEYHCMIQFVKPNLLGTRKEFTNRFANPIKNGQCADSTEHDVRIMKRRAHVLHKKLEGCVQRFDYSVLTPFLPPKHEYVISVKLSELQINMYRHYLEKCARGGPNASMPAGRGKGSGLFADFQELGKVWTHPRAMQLAQIRREQRAACDSEDSMVDFIDDGSGSEGEEEVVCLDDSDGESNEEAEEENAGIAWKSRTRAGRGNQPPPEEDLNNVVTSNCWWSQFVTEEDMEKIEHSGKLILLRDILRKCELIGDKVLVFSQSLVSLDLIEEFLHLEDQNRLQEDYAKDGEDVPLGSWKLNVDYFRFDGSTSAELRKNWCNSFNSPKNTRSRLFLISTRAGGLGINMTAANRVVIFDASWNPSHDVQSIFRVYRFGQKKPCYIYRFLAQGTMEEKIYDRQVTKLSLSCRVVDEQQIERHFNASDLAELYRFDAESHTRRPTPMVPKDRLLAELMMSQKQWITTFHEHDSLLQNKAEEELNEEERKAAWEDYENENRGIFSNPLLEASGGPGSLENQMQMLAGRSVAGIPLTHLASMIRSNNPAITPAELMQRLQLTVEQLQNLSVQQYMAAASGLGINQQPLDVQRLLLQRQQAMEQAKSQFPGIAMQSLLQAASMGLNVAGPSGVMQAPARRGRPPIGPYQRTDMGYPPIRPNILSSTPRIAPSAKNPPANKPAK